MNSRSNNREENGQGAPRLESGLRPAAKADSKDEITVSELREVLSRRRVPLLVCVVLGVLGGIALSLTMPARYEAVSSLSVNFQPSASSGVEALAQAAGVSDPTTLQTQVSILETDSLAWEAIRALRLDQRSETVPQRFGFGPAMCQSGPTASIDSVGMECRQMLLEEFHKRLHVQAVPRTEVIQIAYRCKSRYLAAEVVNTLASLYTERVFQMRYEAATKNSAWLAGQLDGVRKDAAEAAQKLIAYQEQSGEVGVEGGPNLALARLTGLSQQLIVAQAERIVQEARYRTAQSGDPEAMVAIGQGTTLQLLHAQDAALGSQYAELDAQFGDSYPRVVQVKAQLAKVQEEMKAELARTTEKLHREYDAAVNGEEMLRGAVEAQKQAVYSSSKAGVEATLLNRDLEASGELYRQIARRLKTGGILAAGNGPDVSVLDPGSPPLRRAEPHAGLNLMAGAIAGLILGLIAIALLEGFDSRIATLKDAGELCPVSGVGVIPCLRAGGARSKSVERGALDGVEVMDQPDGEVADAFWRLRTSLIHAGAGGAPKAILVTSPLAGEGTWAVSANLAAAFARMNRRVLLVDADLRGNAGGGAHNSSEPGGLAQALRGEDYHSCCAPRQRIESLVLLPAGEGSPNPPDLLDSARMRALIEQWRQEYDQVIIDLPRLNVQSDAAILSTVVDTVLLTVRVGGGRRKDIQSSMEILGSIGAGLHGAVVVDRQARGLLARTASWNSHPFNGHRKEYGNA